MSIKNILQSSISEKGATSYTNQKAKINSSLFQPANSKLINKSSTLNHTLTQTSPDKASQLRLDSRSNIQLQINSQDQSKKVKLKDFLALAKSQGQYNPHFFKKNLAFNRGANSPKLGKSGERESVFKSNKQKHNNLLTANQGNKSAVITSSTTLQDFLRSNASMQCIKRNTKAFQVQDGTVDDYHEYLLGQQDNQMRGMLRVMNPQQSSLVSFPYPQNMIKSQYKEQYSYKDKVKQGNFNMEKEKLYFKQYKRPQTQAANPRRQILKDEVIDPYKDSGRIGTVEDQLDPKNNYLTTTRGAFQDPFKSKFIRSVSTKNGERSTNLVQDNCFPQNSMYKAAFVNWGKGVKLVEKRPDLPRQYKLRFFGKSTYKEQCENSDKMWKEIKEKRNFHQNMDTQYQNILRLQMAGNLGSITKSSNFLNNRYSHDFGNYQDKGDFGINKTFHVNIDYNNESIDFTLDNSMDHLNSLKKRGDHFLTSKMKNDREIERNIRHSKNRGERALYKDYRSKPFIRPKSALQTTMSASQQLRQSPAHFDTTYKKNFIKHQNNKPLYVPYP
ncbi:UNKNOWN [Stylonychia lemnae]|uniref:Uncharacterized protein n=1 Tax=Stylonychia lemnae TaxID=5949 RepID=A0A078AS66_STYLE|nr:UNKNOWN [Stylonychia lemnae]|eukprot:CDW85009.1 UNKNOWN [Stylonychia lemnae]